MEYKKYIIGLLIVLVAQGIIYTYLNDDVGQRVDKLESKFYIQENDMWVISGIEQNKLFSGTKLQYRDLKNTLVYNYTSGEMYYKVRETPYKNGAYIIDTYSFNGNISNKESFPISHKIEVFNGTGMFYRYTAKRLVYEGDTYKLTGETSLSFGRNMEIDLQPNYRWGYVYKSGSVQVQYDINSDYEVYYIRMFDPDTVTLYLDGLSEDRFYERGSVAELNSTHSADLDVCYNIDAYGYGDNYTCTNSSEIYNFTTFANQFKIFEQNTSMILFFDGETIPDDWTCISCDSGDTFFERFPMASNTYGVTGGNLEHNHTMSIDSFSAPSGIISHNLAVGVNASSDTHTHNISEQRVSNESNIPLSKGLKIIQYDLGIPTIIPAGAIAMFNDTIPIGWSLYTENDGYYIIGNSTNSTIGSLNHTHEVNITTSNTSSYSNIGIKSGTYNQITHTHTGTGNSDIYENLPSYIEVILASADSDIEITSGLIAMFNSNETYDNYEILSNSGGDFYNKFIVGNSTYYGNDGGSLTHQHSNIEITLSEPSTTNSNGWITGDTVNVSIGTHTHNLNISYSNESYLPPYTTVIVGYALYDELIINYDEIEVEEINITNNYSIYINFNNQDNIQSASIDLYGYNSTNYPSNIKIDIENDGVINNYLIGELIGENAIYSDYYTSYIWESYSNIIYGLVDVGLSSTPEVFEIDSTNYLISGDEGVGGFHGYNLNGYSWSINTDIINGLTNTGQKSYLTIFEIDSTQYLISGEFDANFNGWNWTGSTWQSDTNIISGLVGVILGTPEVFEIDSTNYLIHGNVGGTFIGYVWNGTSWISNSSIVSGLSSVGGYSTPTVFQKDSTLYLISGNGAGTFNGWNWTGSTWQVDSNIILGLEDVGVYSTPTVWYNNLKWYLISGEHDGVFNGFIFNLNSSDSTAQELNYSSAGVETIYVDASKDATFNEVIFNLTGSYTNYGYGGYISNSKIVDSYLDDYCYDGTNFYGLDAILGDSSIYELDSDFNINESTNISLLDYVSAWFYTGLACDEDYFYVSYDYVDGPPPQKIGIETYYKNGTILKSSNSSYSGLITNDVESIDKINDIVYIAASNSSGTKYRYVFRYNITSDTFINFINISDYFYLTYSGTLVTSDNNNLYFVVNGPEMNIIKFNSDISYIGAETIIRPTSNSVANNILTDRTKLYVGYSKYLTSTHEYFSYFQYYSLYDNPSNVFVDIGDDGTYELDVSNIDSSTQVTGTTAFQTYVDEHSATEGIVSVPIVIGTETQGSILVSDLNQNYSFNPISLNYSAFNLNSSLNTTKDVEIEITSDDFGTIEVSDINIPFYGSQNISVTSFQSNDTSINDTQIIKVVTSDITQSLPYTWTDDILWYPSSLTESNIQPFGQRRTTPIYNITFDHYHNQGVNLSIYFNETPNSCMNFTASSSYNKSLGSLLSTNNYWIFNDSIVDENDGIWIWLDIVDCNSSAYRWLSYPLNITTKCSTCV